MGKCNVHGSSVCVNICLIIVVFEAMFQAPITVPPSRAPHRRTVPVGNMGRMSPDAVWSANPHGSALGKFIVVFE